MAYNLLTNKTVSPVVSIPSEGGDYTVVMVVKSSAGIKTHIDGDKASIDVSIKAVLNVEQAGKETDITQPDTVKKVEDSFDAKMEEEISEAIKKAQTEFASDIFGFGQDVHIQHPDIWRDIKDKWNDDYFANADVNVEVDSSIALTGKLEKPFNMEGMIK
jgi:spore germination protein KC